MTLATHEVRLIGRNETSVEGGCLSKGMIVAFLHEWGVYAWVCDRLKSRRSWEKALGPKCWKKEGENLSGPGAPLAFIAAIAPLELLHANRRMFCIPDFEPYRLKSSLQGPVYCC